MLFQIDDDHDFDNDGSPDNRPICTAATDENGHLNFVTENRKIISFQELAGKGMKYFVLRETAHPVGYRNNGDISLYYSQYGDSSGDGVLLSYNYWKTGAYTQAKLSVTMTDELYEYVYTDGSAGPEAGDQIGAGESDTAGYLDNGIIFAVPVKRIDTNGSLYDESNFHAVYGTIHSGWTMMSDSIENKESVL